MDLRSQGIHSYQRSTMSASWFTVDDIVLTSNVCKRFFIASKTFCGFVFQAVAHRDENYKIFDNTKFSFCLCSKYSDDIPWMIYIFSYTQISYCNKKKFGFTCFHFYSTESRFRIGWFDRYQSKESGGGFFNAFSNFFAKNHDKGKYPHPIVT